MQTNEQIERARTIGALFGAFGQGADEARIAIYVRMLKDIPVDVLKVTAEKVMMENKFLPTIAELVEATRSLMAEAEPDTRVKTWAEAWAGEWEFSSLEWYHHRPNPTPHAGYRYGAWG